MVAPTPTDRKASNYAAVADNDAGQGARHRAFMSRNIGLSVCQREAESGSHSSLQDRGIAHASNRLTFRTERGLRVAPQPIKAGEPCAPQLLRR